MGPCLTPPITHSVNLLEPLRLVEGSPDRFFRAVTTSFAPLHSAGTALATCNSHDVLVTCRTSPRNTSSAKTKNTQNTAIADLRGNLCLIDLRPLPHRKENRAGMDRQASVILRPVVVVVVVEWLYYSKRIIIVRWADLIDFFRSFSSVKCPMKIATFLLKNDYTPKRVVDFPWERDTFRNKIMEIVEDLTKKVTTTTVNPGNRRGFCV